MRQGSAGLTLREFQVYQERTFELTPKNIKTWAKELPITNLGESARGCYQLLVDLNQALVDPDKRFAMLKLVEPVANYLVESLEKQFLKTHIVLSEKQRKIAALVQAIETELSLGCHAVIESINANDIKRSQKKLLAEALVMAIKYHGLVMLRCFKLYTSVPARLWRELYCLYQISKRHELEDVAVESRNENNMSAQQCFLRVLLLSISNPYQLRQAEIQELWQLLPEISEFASLMSHAYNKDHFVICLDRPIPPLHKSLHKPSDNGTYLKLTAFTAVEHLKQMLEGNQLSQQWGVRKNMLIRHLIRCWSNGVQRTFARTPCGENIDVSIGLGATHYLLLQSLDSEDLAEDTARDTLEAMEGSMKNATLLDLSKKKRAGTKSSHDFLSSGAPPDDDVWAKLYRPEQVMKEALNEMESKNRSRESIVKDSYKLQSVDLLNMSPAGYCIQIETQDLPGHAQPGEILGFLESDDNSLKQWSVGVVRWVRRLLKGTSLQMGVQLLAPDAKPVNIQLRNSKGDENEFQRALLLPELSAVGQPQSLVTNQLSFSVNSKIRVHDQDRQFEARLSKEIAASSSFKQFQFEKISSGGNAKAGPKSARPPSSSDQELDGIWDLI